MAKLVQRIETNIHSTLNTFEVGESMFIPYFDVVNSENGEIITRGSRTNTNTWRTRYNRLRGEQANLSGTFKFRNMKDPDGTLIVRLS